MLVVVVAAPVAATAATADVEPYPIFGVVYLAAPGEANVLSASAGGTLAAANLSFADLGASITAGSGCTSGGPHAVACSANFVGPLGIVALNDRDDSARLPASPALGGWIVDGGAGDDSVDAGAAAFGAGATVNGGPGNDVLTGSEVDDKLDGGPGDDVIYGQAGFDTLDGGGGRDKLFGGGKGRDSLVDGDREGSVDADVLDGGGRGLLDYSSRTRPVRVDLTNPGHDGENGEGDVVRGISQVRTGAGNDTLIGTNGDNALDGGRGADRIVGRGGRDRLVTTNGDLVDAGPGNDSIDVGPLASATVTCGSGSDLVHTSATGTSSAGPLLSRSCERLLTFLGSFSPPRPVAASRRGRLVFSVTCLDCGAVRLDITAAKRPFRLLARRRAKLLHARTRVGTRLPRRVARSARQRPVPLRVHFTAGKGPAVNWRFVLRLR
jgi:hypothetical protein